MGRANANESQYRTRQKPTQSTQPFDNSLILCYATHVIVIHRLWIKMIAAANPVENLN
jgi:hypothetical protein